MKMYPMYLLAICLVVIPMSVGCTPQQQSQFFDQAGMNPSQTTSPAGDTSPTATPTATPSNGNSGNSGNTGGGNSGSPDPTPVFENVTEQRFSASLSGVGSEKGNAAYRERGTRRRLKVELENATPGSVHAIMVDGINIGELTVGPLGSGQVEFDTEIQPDHVPWPLSLPTRLSTGTAIQVGSTSGTLGV